MKPVAELDLYSHLKIQYMRTQLQKFIDVLVYMADMLAQHKRQMQ